MSRTPLAQEKAMWAATNQMIHPMIVIYIRTVRRHAERFAQDRDQWLASRLWDRPTSSGHRGRDAGYPTPPAQIPACRFLAPGSSEILASARRRSDCLRSLSQQ